jgi:hypothetical protein
VGIDVARIIVLKGFILDFRKVGSTVNDAIFAFTCHPKDGGESESKKRRHDIFARFSIQQFAQVHFYLLKEILILQRNH